MATPPDPGTSRVTIQLPDPLKHFSKDPPGFRLAAHLIPKVIHAVVAVCVTYITWASVNSTRVPATSPQQVAAAGPGNSAKPAPQPAIKP